MIWLTDRAPGNGCQRIIPQNHILQVGNCCSQNSVANCSGFFQFTAALNQQVRSRAIGQSSLKPESCRNVNFIDTGTRMILCMRPAKERRRYIVTSFLTGWAYTQNYPSRKQQRMSYLQHSLQPVTTKLALRSLFWFQRLQTTTLLRITVNQINTKPQQNTTKHGHLGCTVLEKMKNKLHVKPCAVSR